MAYIGRPSIVGNFVKLDAISVVNGQAAYTMQNGSANFTDYSTVNQFMVSLNGTIQSPGSSFTVSGSTITFASNLVTNDVIDFIIVFGNSLSAGTPTDGTVTAAKLADGVLQPPHRNIIINGDMSIAQRSTSVSSLTSSSTYQTIDRYATELGSNGTWTQSQSTDVPTGQGFAKSLKMDCTATGSGGYLHITQRFEGQNLQYLKKGTSNAESLTLSFWVKSAKTGTYIAEFRDIDNTRNISKSYTISSADTWEKKTITYPGDTSGAFGNDHDSSLELNLWLAAGSSNTSGTLQTSWGSQVAANRAVGQVNLGDSTSNEWYITGLQLEAETSASEFQFLPHDVNLRRCLRYCYAVNGIASDETGLVASGLATSTSTLKISLDVPVPLRAYPSVSEAGLQANIVGGAQDVSLASVQDNANSTFNPSNITINLTADSGTPFTAGHSLVLRLDNATSANLKIDAEL